MPRNTTELILLEDDIDQSSLHCPGQNFVYEGVCCFPPLRIHLGAYSLNADLVPLVESDESSIKAGK